MLILLGRNLRNIKTCKSFGQHLSKQVELAESSENLEISFFILPLNSIQNVVPVFRLVRVCDRKMASDCFISEAFDYRKLALHIVHNRTVLEQFL